VRFAAITLCVASQRVFIVVSVYYVIDSVRKLLDTPSYSQDILSCAVVDGISLGPKFLISVLEVGVTGICV
jgi:hypothetical protein